MEGARQGEEKLQPTTSPWDLLEGDGSHQPMHSTWLFENFPADQHYSLRLLSNTTALQEPFCFLLTVIRPLFTPPNLSACASSVLKTGTRSTEDADRYYEYLESYYFVDRNGCLFNEINFITIQSRVNNYTAKSNLKLLSPRSSLLRWETEKYSRERVDPNVL